MQSIGPEKVARIRKKRRSARRKPRRRVFTVESLEPRNLLASVGIGFTGGSGPGFVPPDTMGAVGPDAIVEIINGRFAVYDKTGAQQTASSLDQFWIDSGVTPAGGFSFDPRILYDAASSRWFAVSVDNAGAANNFLVAVSDDSDPTGGWTGFQIDSDADNSHWADYPMLGMNQEVVTISANMFGIGGGAANASFLVLPKADLLAATPTVANRTLIEDVTLTGFGSQPVVDMDNGDLPLNILSSFNKPAGTIKASSIVGTPTAPTINAVGGTINVTPRNSPPNIDQPGTKTDIDAGDDRFGGNVVQQQIEGRSNPSLWGVHGVDIDGRASIEWYEIDAVTYTLLQSGTIADSSLAFNYPSIAVNDLGDIAIGFSGGDPSTFMSTYVVTGQTTDGVTTLDPPIQTQAGVADYENLDGIGRNRWGDYSATVVDPADELTMWTFQEFASGVDEWSIRVTEIIFAPPTQIQGMVWNDQNANGARDANEFGISNWTVFLDLDKNGDLDTNEPSAITDANGRYTLETSVGPGGYSVAQVIPPSWEPTFPVNGIQTVSITQRGETISGIDFGNKSRTGTVTGFKWYDIDGDGIHDLGEPGQGGIWIYADTNNDGLVGLLEPAAITAADGTYTIHDVPGGKIPIRESLPLGWTTTFPALGYHLVDVVPDAIVEDIDFGNFASFDYGDAPSDAGYATLKADGGAFHGITPGYQLGALIDAEDDGLPSPTAMGDDLDNLADEDGVKIDGELFQGTTDSVEVTIETSGYPRGYLQGWIDFNADGDWDDPGEQIATNLRLDSGTYTIAFAVPSGADVTVGTSFARFRYGIEIDLGPTGGAIVGEVEDYEVLILKDAPVAISDSYEVVQDSINNSFDVLNNDFHSSTGVLTITQVTQPANGTVSIAPGGQTVIYTPDFGTFSPPNDVFRYTIDDGTGKTDSASVTVIVRPELNAPVSVDDVFRVGAGSDANGLDVLANDLTGVLGTMQLISVTAPGSGTATIDNNGTADPLDDFIVYTPSGAFARGDQFEYTVSNLNGMSTATVTVFESPAPADLGVDLGIHFEDLVGNPIDQVDVDDQFVMVVSIQDIRGGVAVEDMGMFSAFLDVLYDRSLVLPVIDLANPVGVEISYSSDYPNSLDGAEGDADTPGLLNEVGSFTSSFTPLGPSNLEVFRVLFTANATGVADFLGDPADFAPVRDVIYAVPPVTAPYIDISYGIAALTIVGADGEGGSGGESRDVNADGYVTPLDALLVISHLNNGSSSNASGSFNPRLDVNRDRYVSPLDALLVIAYLNGGEGEGEGEDRGFLAADTSTSTTLTPDLLSSDPATVLGTLDQPAFQVAVANSLFHKVDDAPVDATAEEWRLSVGGTRASTATSVDPAGIATEHWEALLNTLAEDVLEATFDGEDA